MMSTNAQEEAARLKDLGNSLFAAKRFGEAIATYSQALELEPTSHVLLSNRSAAFLASGNALMALTDATSALRQSPSFVKGYSRKAAALFALGQVGEALLTARQGLKWEPDSVPLRDLVNQSQEALKKQQEAQQHAANEGDRLPSLGEPSNAQPHKGGSEQAPVSTTLQDDLGAFFAEVENVESKAVEAARKAREEKASAAGESAKSGQVMKHLPGISDAAREAAAALEAEEEDTYEALERRRLKQEDEDRKKAIEGASGNKQGEDERATAEDTGFLFSGQDIDGKSTAPETEAQKRLREDISARIAAQDLGTGKAQIERLVGNPHAFWLNLNPFEVLALPPEASLEDIAARHKRLSAIVHPDKHLADTDRARAAFDELRKALESLQDKRKRLPILTTISLAYSQARKLWKAQQKSSLLKLAPNQVRPPAASNAPSAVGASLEELRVREVRRLFAENEQRKRSHEARVKAEATKEAQRELEEQEAEAMEREEEAKWREGTNTRAEGWLSFKQQHLVCGASADTTSGAAEDEQDVSLNPRPAKRRRLEEGDDSNGAADAGIDGSLPALGGLDEGDDEGGGSGKRGLRLNAVARFGVGKFESVVAQGAAGSVTQGAQAVVVAGSGRTGDAGGTLGGLEETASSFSSFRRLPSHKPSGGDGAGGGIGMNDYKKAWR